MELGEKGTPICPQKKKISGFFFNKIIPAQTLSNLKKKQKVFRLVSRSKKTIISQGSDFSFFPGEPLAIFFFFFNEIIGKFLVNLFSKKNPPLLDF